MTSDRIVKPIRAWAEYEDRRRYIFWDDLWDTWETWSLPLSASGGPYQQPGYNSIVDAVSDDGPRAGSLRSLRVRYDNGYELRLTAVGFIEGLAPELTHWAWSLWPETGMMVADNDSFAEDRDSEAVERAMIAASAWFTQRQDV
jgi:hypothetical protein